MEFITLSKANSIEKNTSNIKNPVLHKGFFRQSGVHKTVLSSIAQGISGIQRQRYVKPAASTLSVIDVSALRVGKLWCDRAGVKSAELGQKRSSAVKRRDGG